MAEKQRIHPVDVEARGGEKATPTVPLMPHGRTALSDEGDPVAYPPQHRSFPVAHSRPPKRRRGCCCRCLCWSLCLVLVLVVLLGITVGALYLIFRPKIPKYSVDHISITQFNVSVNGTVAASFNVKVTATNPNSKIGIYYLDGSHLRVRFEETELCEGQLPVFYQGHRNTTLLNVIMTGQTRFDGSLLSELQAAQNSGSVPIDFRGKVPVKLKLGSLKLFKVKPLVRCHLVLSGLAANQVIHIKSSHCKFKFRL